MSKVIKLSLYAICVVVLILTIGAILLLLFFDPNSYKQTISDNFYAKTGCKMAINGDISWFFFPSLRLQVSNVVITNPSQFTANTPLATLGTANFSIKTLPLLKRHIEASKIQLIGLNLNLIKKSSKLTNWGTLIEQYQSNKAKKIPAQPATSTISEHRSTTSDDFKLTINNIALNNARINLDDQMRKQQGSFLVHSLGSSHINFDGIPFPIQVVFDIQQSNLNLKSKTTLQTMMQIDKAKRHFKLDKLKAVSEIVSSGLPTKLRLTLKSSIGYDFESTQIAINDLATSLNNLAITATLNGKLNGPDLQGQLQTDAFDSKHLLESLGINIKIPNPSMLEDTHAKTEFTIEPQRLNLDMLEINLGDTFQISGNTKIEFAKHKLDANLAINKLDLNQFTPFTISQTLTEPIVKISDPTAKPTMASAVITATNKTQQLTAVNNATIGLAIGAFKFKKFVLENIVAKITYKNKNLSLGFENADFYKGKISGINTINYNSTPCQIKINEILQDVDLQPLLIDFLNVNLIEGTGNVSINIKGAGNLFSMSPASISGTTQIKIEDGEINVLDILYLLDLAVAKYDNKSLPTEPNKYATKFSTFESSFKIKDGIAKTNSLYMIAPTIQAHGKGKINLIQKKLDIRMDIEYTGNQANILNVQSKTGGSIPIIISGKFDNINATIDYPLLLRRAAAIRLGKTTEEASKKIEKNVQKLGDDFNKRLNKIGDKLQNFLR